MQEIAISEFKAKCLALLERVCKTKKPIRITRFGRPVADVFPPSPAEEANWVGSMVGSIEFVGDVAAPAIEESDFEALR